MKELSMITAKLFNTKYANNPINISIKENNNSIRQILCENAHSIIQQKSIDFLANKNLFIRIVL